MVDSETQAETALACLSIVLAGVFLFEGAKLKPGVFEPIGPGAVPMGVAVITIVLSLVVLWTRWRKSGDTAASAVALPDSPLEREKWCLLLAVAALTVAYTAILQTGVARYGLVTVVYLLVTFLVVSGSVRRDLRWSVALALVFGMGLDYVFRYLLVADLP